MSRQANPPDLTAASSPRHLPLATALVTGATAGIGRAFAAALAQQGRRVVLVARGEDALRDTLARLPGDGHEILSADLASESGVQLVAERIARTPRIGLLINNVGSGRYGTFHKQDAATQLQMVRLNCHALVALAHAFLRQAKPGDCLINVSSILAFMPQPTSAVYAATKSFVTSFSESLWFENQARGVYVMGLHPGITRTEFRVRAGGTPSYPSTAHTPEQVVQTAIRQMQLRRHPTVVCGAQNCLLAQIPRLVSRRAMVSFMGSTRSYEP